MEEDKQNNVAPKEAETKSPPKKPMTADEINIAAKEKIAVNREQLVEHSKEMFDNLSAYLQAELQTTLTDYAVLEKLNAAAQSKYQEMTSKTKELGNSVESFQEEKKNLAPFLAEIDDLDVKSHELVDLVSKLDDYSKQLEGTIKRLEKESHQLS